MIDKKSRKIKNIGFSIIEIIIILAILFIIAMIAVPKYSGYLAKTRKAICNANCLQLERMYEAYLEAEQIKHTEATFIQFIEQYGKSICPEHGDITYIDCKVRCSIHTIDNEKEYGDDVPFLLILKYID